jgi:outer membrane murein-binding lipoprotein Lpp
LTVVNTWTDSRLDDLASVVRPLPGEVAQLSVKVDGIARDTELIRADLSALQRQLAQIGRAIAGTLAVGLIAILIALV